MSANMHERSTTIRLELARQYMLCCCCDTKLGQPTVAGSIIRKPES